MRLVSIKQTFIDIFDFPTEIMSKDSNGNNRPFLLILSLQYKDEKRSFALPFRSNIQVNSHTKGTYFSLPRRHSTKDRHAHGLHYIKMFPIEKQYCDKYIVPNKKYDLMISEYITKNIDKIVNGAQSYLVEYENGKRHNFCVDIDRMLNTLNEHKAKQETIETEKQIAALDKE